MGVLSQVLRLNRWTIVSPDPEVVLVVTGQYEPEGGATEDKPPAVTAHGTAGSGAPTVQWVAGGARVVRIASAFVSLNMADDIRPRKLSVQSMVERDPVLGRAPKVTFTWGDIEVTGFVTGLTGRTIGLWVTGWPKVYEFELEITETPDVTVKTGAPASGETQWIALADGETFETLGLRYYGDPLRGELIRRENPALATGEAAGDRVKVLEREHPRARGAVHPTAPPFLDRTRSGATWQPVLEELAVVRGYETGSVRWEHLPEVIDGSVDAAVE